MYYPDISKRASFLSEPIYFFSGNVRVKIGLPIHWPPIMRWLDKRRPVYNPPPRPPPPTKRKCPDIPVLSSYKTTPSARFWSCFPSRALPAVPRTPVNVPILQRLLTTHSSDLTRAQQIRGRKVITELTEGVDALQMADLPAAIITELWFSSTVRWSVYGYPGVLDQTRFRGRTVQ